MTLDSKFMTLTFLLNPKTVIRHKVQLRPWHTNPSSTLHENCISLSTSVQNILTIIDNSQNYISV